jgi:hypothetical protein
MPIKSTATDLKPRPSRLLAWILGSFHVLVALVVLASVAYRPAAAALLLVTVWSWYRAYRLHCQYRGRQAIRRLSWLADGQWVLEDGSRQAQAALLLPSSYLHPRLLILNFKLVANGHRRNVLLLPDSLDAESLRQLRSRLRVEASISHKSAIKQA